MKRSRLVAAIALSVGVSSWLQWGTGTTALAGDYDNSYNRTCKCGQGHGLLDTLDNYAAKLVKDRTHSPSILSSFRLSLDKSKSQCDCQVAGCEEPSCGIELACDNHRHLKRRSGSCCASGGCSCGHGQAALQGSVLPNGVVHHGVIQHGVIQHGVIQHGVVQQDVVQQGVVQQGVVDHRVVQPHMQPGSAQPGASRPGQTNLYRSPEHIRSLDPPPIPHVEAVQPALPIPKVPPLNSSTPEAERIPVPTSQDATIDPFLDDSASNLRPARLPVRPATTPLQQHRRTSATPAAAQRPALDTRSRTAPSLKHQSKTNTVPPQRELISSILSSRRSPAGEASLGGVVKEQSAQTAQRQAREIVNQSNLVVPAAASAPAKVPVAESALPALEETVYSADEAASRSDECRPNDGAAQSNPLRD